MVSHIVFSYDYDYFMKMKEEVSALKGLIPEKRDKEEMLRLL